MKNDYVYYLENRVELSENSVRLFLFDVTLYDENPNADLKEIFIYYDCNVNLLYDNELYTGFICKNKNLISSANNTTIAKRYIFNNTKIRSLLHKRITNRELNASESINTIRDDTNTTDLISEKQGDDIVISYHINVGHGNCSIILCNEKIYMIDCSEYDYLIHKSFLSNILDCIDYIKKKNNIKNFFINTFVLTHPHFDHYSGIISLIKHQYINSETTVYINTYYSVQNPKYTEMLYKLKATKCIIINPLMNNSHDSMNIVYPPSTVIKNGTNTYPTNEKPIIDSNPNNASVVTLFSNAGRSFLFPGDLEKEGWNKMNPCKICNKTINYYALSHHGSINGFYRNKCTKGKNIQNVAMCMGSSTAIFLGRIGAYSGIPSSKVMQSFNPIYFSEKDNNGNPIKFFELDWKNNLVKYFP